jgi:hypothetical protein
MNIKVVEVWAANAHANLGRIKNKTRRTIHLN